LAGYDLEGKMVGPAEEPRGKTALGAASADRGKEYFRDRDVFVAAAGQ